MANEQNIIPHRFTSEQSREQAAINGAKGGAASGESRRRRKALAESLNALLALPIAPGDITELDSALSADGLENANLSVLDRIALSLVRKAIEGNTKAAELIRDTIGEKPADKLEITEAASIEAASEQIRELMRRSGEQQRRKAEILKELLDSPDLPEHARGSLIELYGFEAMALSANV